MFQKFGFERKRPLDKWLELVIFPNFQTLGKVLLSSLTVRWGFSVLKSQPNHMGLSYGVLVVSSQVARKRGPAVLPKVDGL